MASYKARVTCENCDWEGVLVIVKGKPVSNLPCPGCGCLTLKQGVLAGSALRKRRVPDSIRGM